MLFSRPIPRDTLNSTGNAHNGTDSVPFPSSSFLKEKYHYHHMCHRNQLAKAGILLLFYNAYVFRIYLAAFLLGHMVMYLRYCTILSQRQVFQSSEKGFFIPLLYKLSRKTKLATNYKIFFEKSSLNCHY